MFRNIVMLNVNHFLPRRRTFSFSPFLLEDLALVAWPAPLLALLLRVLRRPEDGGTDVTTAGCTIQLRAGEVEMAVTVGTKESAASPPVL